MKIDKDALFFYIGFLQNVMYRLILGSESLELFGVRSLEKEVKVSSQMPFILKMYKSYIGNRATLLTFEKILTSKNIVAFDYSTSITLLFWFKNHAVSHKMLGKITVWP